LNNVGTNISVWLGLKLGAFTPVGCLVLQQIEAHNGVCFTVATGKIGLSAQHKLARSKPAIYSQKNAVGLSKTGPRCVEIRAAIG